ncbi:calcineurin regulatory subunit B, partial [Reticulomyxa filosa]
MGGATSNLTPEDIEELKDESISQFSAAEIKKLYKRFEHLDRNHMGFITSNDLELIPELSLNPLCKRIIELFDVEDRNQINFRDFVKMLWTFSVSASKQEKLNLAFRCYDIDNDGEISTNDLCTLLRDMVGKQISDSQLIDIAKHIIAKNETKPNPTGKLTKQEFLQTIGEDVLIEKMTISFAKEDHMLIQVIFFLLSFKTLFCGVCKRYSNQSYFLECSRLMTSGAI